MKIDDNENIEGMFIIVSLFLFIKKRKRIEWLMDMFRVVTDTKTPGINLPVHGFLSSDFRLRFLYLSSRLRYQKIDSTRLVTR